jgi:hypothetical protein
MVGHSAQWIKVGEAHSGGIRRRSRNFLLGCAFLAS